MFRLRIALCFFLICAIFLTACAGEPRLPSEIIENVIIEHGYALAPTYPPKGFEHIPVIDSSIPILEMGTSTTVRYVYQKSDLEKGSVEIFMMYPSDAGRASSFGERLGLEVPEDAVSEPNINGIKAYLFHGNWSTDTLRRIARIELPINPEWDYDGGISIRFAIDVPDYGRVWVYLGTVLPTDEVNDKDLVRIAKSVVVTK